MEIFVLIPFDSLSQLPQETLDNLIKEHLLSQIEDINFDNLDLSQINLAIEQCKLALKKGELIVEYGEVDESIAIKSKEQTHHK